MVNKIKGRAEYEQISDLFEGKNATEIYPFAEKGDGIGMIVGERGCGKTYLIRKLFREIPGEIYTLDKNTLKYEILEKKANPKFIAVDDLHYLAQAMRLKKLEGNPLYEQKVLNALHSFKDKAEKAEASLIFVSDDGPGGLSFSFEEENKKEFLELLKDCAPMPDDYNIFHRYLDYHPSFHRKNILRFRNNEWWNKNKNVREVEEMLRMGSIPFLVPYLDLRRFFWNTKDCVYKDGEILELFEDGKLIKSYKDIKIPKRQIAPIRELKVVSDALGGVNERTLGIDFGIPEKAIETYYNLYGTNYCLDDEWVENLLERALGEVPSAYSDRIKAVRRLEEDSNFKFQKDVDFSLHRYYFLPQLKKIEELIHKKYRKISFKEAEKEYKPLARALLLAEDEKEAKKIFITHELKKE